jgi:hypothetical protein
MPASRSMATFTADPGFNKSRITETVRQTGIGFRNTANVTVNALVDDRPLKVQIILDISGRKIPTAR